MSKLITAFSSVSVLGLRILSQGSDPLFINTRAQHLKTNIREEDEELMFQDLVRGKDYTRYH